MTIGVSCSAVCTVAVPDAVSATSAAARIASVSPSTTLNSGLPARGERLEKMVVEVRRPRDDELRARQALRICCAAAIRSGRMRETSFGRLPGRIATVGADSDNPCDVRNAARGADGRARSISGWPTNSTGTPPSR